jgi:hypothetical protein
VVINTHSAMATLDAPEEVVMVTGTPDPGWTNGLSAWRSIPADVRWMCLRLSPSASTYISVRLVLTPFIRHVQAVLDT